MTLLLIGSLSRSSSSSGRNGTIQQSKRHLPSSFAWAFSYPALTKTSTRQRLQLSQTIFVSRSGVHDREVPQSVRDSTPFASSRVFSATAGSGNTLRLSSNIYGLTSKPMSSSLSLVPGRISEEFGIRSSSGINHNYYCRGGRVLFSSGSRSDGRQMPPPMDSYVDDDDAGSWASDYNPYENENHGSEELKKYIPEASPPSPPIPKASLRPASPPAAPTVSLDANNEVRAAGSSYGFFDFDDDDDDEEAESASSSSINSNPNPFKKVNTDKQQMPKQPASSKPIASKRRLSWEGIEEPSPSSQPQQTSTFSNEGPSSFSAPLPSPPQQKTNFFDDDDDDTDNDNQDQTTTPSSPSLDTSSTTNDKWQYQPNNTPSTSPPPKLEMTSPPPQSRLDFFTQSSSGYGSTDTIEQLTKYLLHLENEIYALNNQQKFNIASPKQVSLVLFDGEVTSTSKDVLEGLIGGSHSNNGVQRGELARLILDYRKTKSNIKKMEGKKEQLKIQTNRQQKYNPNPNTEDTEEGREEPLLLVDASAYIHRAYHAMPPLHRDDGEPIGAVLGFCNMIHRLVFNRLLNGERPRMVLVFDSKGNNFRHDLYSAYKANRPPSPIDLIPQFEYVRDAARAFGIPQIEAVGFEADDVIATLCTKAVGVGVNVNIVSSDKDLMQLVTDYDANPSVHMLDPMKMARVSTDTVQEKWNVLPGKLGDVLALAGDSSDNVPGVPGIGPKIAATLINEYGDLENLLKNAGNVKQNKRRENLIEYADMARLSRKLVTLDNAVPDELMNLPSSSTKNDDDEDKSTVACISELRMDRIDQNRLLTFYDTMNLRDLKRRTADRFYKHNANGNNQNYFVSGDDDSPRQQQEKQNHKGKEEEEKVVDRLWNNANENGRSGAPPPPRRPAVTFQANTFQPKRRPATPPPPELYDDVPF